ncbi:MAG: UDP-N-acetylmuramoyl-tripeptide--D-alanyl-D-alanine ligase [Bacteroidota bacterium]
MEQFYQLFNRCSGVSTDSRNISDKCLYIALKGERFNGNQFAAEAIEKGANYAIVDEQEYADGDKIFCVPDGLVFLQQLAYHHRMKFDIPVIGITGSNGKTTTKELIAMVLEEKFEILYTRGNLNNHIGVPLTLLQLGKQHDIAIIEMGASKPHDIAELTAIAHPTHGLLTNIGNAHLEGFGGREGVIKTKKELYDAIEEKSGTLFLNSDDEVLTAIIPQHVEIVTYGQNNEAQVQGRLLEFIPEVFFKWRLSANSWREVKTQIIGKYNFYNMMAAVAVGTYFNVNPEQIDSAIATYSPQNNRSQIQKTEHNTLVLDAYNANPTSVQSAIESFSEMPYAEKFYILGDMKELGTKEREFHQEVIDQTQVLGLQGIFVGSIYSEMAQENEKIMAFPNIDSAASFLRTARPKDNLILLKGSRSIGLEKLVKVL